MTDDSKDLDCGGLTRRILLKSLTAVGTAGLPEAEGAPQSTLFEENNSLIGGVDSIGDVGSLYGEIAAFAAHNTYPLSFLNAKYRDTAAYQREARAKIFSLLLYDPGKFSPAPALVKRWEYPNYVQEKIVFYPTPWFPTTAYVLIPKNRAGRRPAIVDLHSHGGMFVYGKEKVMPMPDGDPPAIVKYRQENYQWRSTSLALCERGYVVVSIDAFYFGERRSMPAAALSKLGPDRSKYSVEDVAYLNKQCSNGEEELAKTLFWAGTTWQGIVHWDDIRTVDYLLTRPEVDPARIGCVGISLGGYRSDFLAALDERIRCSISVGWMSALRPLLKSRVTTHSFLHFLPGLTRFMDLPDLAGCVAPKPLMVQQCSRDGLYTLEGMKESVERISAIYRKAGAPEMFQGRFYDEPHTFSIAMQEEAFEWLDRWLKP